MLSQCVFKIGRAHVKLFTTEDTEKTRKQKPIHELTRKVTEQSSWFELFSEGRFITNSLSPTERVSQHVVILRDKKYT